MKRKMFSSLFLCLFLTTITFAQTMLLDYDEALSKSKEESKPIMMIFTGSDWCKPCMEFKKQILQDQTFINYSDESLLLLEVDFPYRRKNRLSKEQQKHNDALAEKYNPNAVFPMLILIDEKGEVLKKMGFDNRLQSQDYIEHINPVLASK